MSTHNALPDVAAFPPGRSVRRAARRGLAHEAADRIREAIFSGAFPLGGALRETDLAAALDVSRGSVREGLAMLEREGLVHSAWHRGTRVIELTAADVAEVYAVRAALDQLAALTAAERANACELAALSELVDTMEAGIREGAAGEALFALDIEFHDLVYATAANSRLLDAWNAVRSQVCLFQLARVRADPARYRERLVDEHRELVELIRNGEPDRLAVAAAEHVHSARRTLVAWLETH